MKIEELNPQAFRPFGKVLCRDPFVGIETGAEFAWADMARGMDLVSPSCTGQLNCRYRERTLRKLERHLKTPEVLVSLKGAAAICVAPASAEAPRREDVRCFRIPEGSALMLNRAVWHWIPYPEEEAGARYLVLFREGTGAEDLNFHEWDRAVRL